ncbi:MAG TPA: hypothetical protein VMR29_06595, partial [Candidatus Binatia bacterium]|nr:hypothetical protein [Candidatus Binatia bacterium]
MVRVVGAWRIVGMPRKRASLRNTLQTLPKEVQLLAAFLAVVLWLLALALLVATFGYTHIRRFDERVLLSLRHPDDLAVPIG